MDTQRYIQQRYVQQRDVQQRDVQVDSRPVARNISQRKSYGRREAGLHTFPRTGLTGNQTPSPVSLPAAWPDPWPD